MLNMLNLSTKFITWHLCYVYKLYCSVYCGTQATRHQCIQLIIGLCPNPLLFYPSIKVVLILLVNNKLYVVGFIFDGMEN